MLKNRLVLFTMYITPFPYGANQDFNLLVLTEILTLPVPIPDEGRKLT